MRGIIHGRHGEVVNPVTRPSYVKGWFESRMAYRGRREQPGDSLSKVLAPFRPYSTGCFYLLTSKRMYAVLDKLPATSRNWTIMRIIAALLVALLAASPSGAQNVTGDAPSIIPRAKPATSDHEGSVTGDSARRSIDEFAACVLGRRRKPALQALALPSGSLEQSKALGSLGAKECIASGN